MQMRAQPTTSRRSIIIVAISLLAAAVLLLFVKYGYDQYRATHNPFQNLAAVPIPSDWILQNAAEGSMPFDASITQINHTYRTATEDIAAELTRLRDALAAGNFTVTNFAVERCKSTNPTQSCKLEATKDDLFLHAYRSLDNGERSTINVDYSPK